MGGLPDWEHGTRGCHRHDVCPDRDRPTCATFCVELSLMSSAVTHKRLPRHAILHDEPMIEGYAQSTQAGVYDLHPSEIFWRDRQAFLDKRGYTLRKRYSPDWKPSWAGTNLNPLFCEDFIVLTVRILLGSSIVSRPLTILLSLEVSGH